MDLLFELRQLLKFIAMPPGLFLLGGVVGLWFYKKRAWARRLTWGALLTLIVTSTGFVSTRALQTVEHHYPAMTVAQAAPLTKEKNLQAIVVLGGGLRLGALDDTDKHAPGAYTLERLAYAAQLQRATGLPILVSGGRIAPSEVTEAKGMADALKELFGVSATWLEDQSLTTHENAQFSIPILKKAGVNSAFLVSSALHMPRSMREFGGQGITFIPLGTGYNDSPVVWRSFLPSARGSDKFSVAVNEWLGIVWYTMKACLTGKC